MARARMGKRRKPQKVLATANQTNDQDLKLKISRPDPIDTSHPDRYIFDDTPKSFKRLLNPAKAPRLAPTKASKPDSGPRVPAKNASSSVKVGKDWDILPGETFRQFNERIGASSKSPNKDKDLKKKKDFRSRIAEEFVEARGLNKKRKEYLKKRDQKKKEKQRLFAGGVSDEEDLDEVRMDSVGFREQVQAPPVLKVLPKASFKFKGKI